MIDQLAAGRRRVDAFGQRAEMDALVPKAHQQVGQVLDRAAQPVELQDDQRIAALQGFQRPVQTGAAGLAAGDAMILEDEIALRGFERVKLHPELLVLGGNPRIADPAPGHLDAWEKKVRHDVTSSKSILFAEVPIALVLALQIGGFPPVFKS